MRLSRSDIVIDRSDSLPVAETSQVQKPYLSYRVLASHFAETHLPLMPLATDCILS